MYLPRVSARHTHLRVDIVCRTSIQNAKPLICGRLLRVGGGSQAPAFAVCPLIKLLYLTIRDSGVGMQLEIRWERHSVISYLNSQLSQKVYLLIDRVGVPLGRIHVASTAFHIILDEPDNGAT
jgi:hypothetical protein